MESTTTYHEIDFLLPAQRFSINFTYVTQKGLPFVREGGFKPEVQHPWIQ